MAVKEFQAGKTYRHEKCLDCDILVEVIYSIGNTGTKLKAHWINRNYVPMGYRRAHEIKPKDYIKWTEVNEPKSN